MIARLAYFLKWKLDSEKNVLDVFYFLLSNNDSSFPELLRVITEITKTDTF